MKRPLQFGIAALVVGLGVVGFMAVRHENQAAVHRANGPVVSVSDRNDVRREHVKLISEALGEYLAAKNGKMPVAVSSSPAVICVGTGANCKKSGLLDLSFLPNNGFIDALPSDPSGALGRFATGYALTRDGNGNFVVVAPRAEGGKTISAKVAVR